MAELHETYVSDSEDTMAERHETCISDLPDELLFHILSYLDEWDQAIFSQVCHRWCVVANDQYLWNRRLMHIGIWNVSKYASFFELNDCYGSNNHFQIKAAIWDPFFLNKTIFAMVSPKVLARKRRQQFMKERQTEASSFISRVKSLVLGSSKEEVVKEEIIPKFVMFGPGLETPGISGIARKILQGQSSLFQAVGMVSGGTIVVKYERQLVHFAVLYSNIKLLRQPLPAQERLTTSKLFTKVSDVWVPSEPAKIACHGASCIVYVIDASTEIENIDDPFPDLTVIIQHTYQFQKNNSKDGISGLPLCLVVLACVPDENSPFSDWQHLLQRLNLWKYNIPWQVTFVIASGITNISIPFDWAVSRIKSL